MAVLRPAHRETEAALRLLKPASRRPGLPAKMTLEGRAAHAAASQRDHEEHGTASIIRQGPYCNHSVVQGQRGVKQITRPLCGVQAFETAQDPRAGLARMPMSKQQQLLGETGDDGLPAAEQCYALAASCPH